jgi:hypothetical protein
LDNSGLEEQRENMPQAHGQSVNLLWTGGWDSTFRLLQLLLLQGSVVQPYYVIDSPRPSTGIEIRTQAKIKKHLFARYPHTKDLLLPTQFKEVSDIQPNQNLTKTFERLARRERMGHQYEYLARFCEETGINAMELSVDYDDRVRGVNALLGPYITNAGTEEWPLYEIAPHFADTDEHRLFKYFQFPLFNLRKTDMGAIAQKEGFDDILELTWFCHTPRGNAPCGVCVPCMYAIEEGMGRRVPLRGRIRYMLRVRPRLKARYPQFYAHLIAIRRRVQQPDW